MVWSMPFLGKFWGCPLPADPRQVPQSALTFLDPASAPLRLCGRPHHLELESILLRFASLGRAKKRVILDFHRVTD